MSAAMKKESPLPPIVRWRDDVRCMVIAPDGAWCSYADVLTREECYLSANAQLQHERNNLRARLEAAEKDAARYRWLRDWESRWHEDAPGLTITSGVYQEYEHSTDELDKVIDAALSPTDAGVTTRGGGE